MRSRTIAILAFAIAFLILALAPIFLPPFYIRVVQNFLFAAALASAWNILGGFAGYWSFGHAGFLGIGGFTAALLHEHAELGGPQIGFVICIFAGAIVSAGVSILLAYPLLRLRGHYFAIAMLGVSLVLSELVANVDFLEGGLGITLSAVEPAGVAPEVFYYFVFLLLFGGTLAVAMAVKWSRIYFGLAAIREDEDAAPMLGVPTLLFKTIAFALSASLTGALGAAYAFSLGYITATSGFRADVGLDLIVYCLLGGIGTLLGPVIGAALMIFLTQVIFGSMLEYHLLLTGLLVIVIILILPRGLVGIFGRRRQVMMHVIDVDAPSTHSTSPMQTDRIKNRTAEPILRLEDVTVQFRGLRALSEVDIRIPPAGIIGIIGPNGAGKSTLFSVITSYIRPTHGSVYFNGERIDGHSTLELSRRGIARAFQIARPFQGMTVFDNIMVGALFGKSGKRDPLAVAEEALEITGLGALRDVPAFGLPVGHLRRLELARVIATRPTLVLADEPCAGLNATETLDVVRILEKLRERGMTVVLVEHDMATIMRVSDHVIVISAGNKICEGIPSDVVQDAAVIEAYLGRPISKGVGTPQATEVSA